ncbi:MAG: hypothetical protein EON93_12180 [Burkholderiales bacterium]|nr:MAG: hypothetical protein EON93_12180 [Burkholderiales bacterium]
MREDQKHFPQDGLALEYWGVALFGYEREEFFDRETGQKVNKPKSAAEATKADRRTKREFHKSKDISDMTFWKDLYVRTFEVLQASIFRSIGSVDKSHRKAIEDELTRALSRLKSAQGKDSIHAQLIASLFRLIFLLLGRSAYAVAGKERNFSTFRTLTYSQTEEQLCWLLKGYIHTNLQAHGFEHYIDADLAFAAWAKAQKKPAKEASVFVQWVRECFPPTYGAFV